MIVYTPAITPRLQYIFDFIGKELFTDGFKLTTDKQILLDLRSPCINYSAERFTKDAFFIAPHNLLFEKGISEQQIDCFEFEGKKCFFRTEGDLPFDIFAASFYLLSRYEEYLPHEKDEYGRYAHWNSLAHREGFLQQPLVNQWILYLRNQLKNRFPSVVFKTCSFTFFPTYDIDIAWSYKHKSWWRQLGGFSRYIFQGRWKDFQRRIAVLSNKLQDPYDAYEWLNQLHNKYGLKPYYFFLLAKKTAQYDKNISPAVPSMRKLVAVHDARYSVGIHPSWQSGDDDALLKEEINTLARITRRPVLASRQHYIRFTLPHTYRKLIANGIRLDFSMGYGTINGFRASVTTPFYWYDLANEQMTDLLLHPFCFMEANSFYEQKDSPDQALKDMQYYFEVVKQVNGTFIMIWHNSLLGTDSLFKGWREAYEEFVAFACKS